MTKKFEIRNSTEEFLTFVTTGKEDGIQVLYKDETVWATQKAMATLFDVDRSVITKHLKNIFDSEELIADRVCANLHILPKTVRPTTPCSTTLTPSSPWVIASIQDRLFRQTSTLTNEERNRETMKMERVDARQRGRSHALPRLAGRSKTQCQRSCLTSGWS